ncbi:hypothetical protein [Lentimicrobium sp.]|uniref:hypothetical protein n=1 Tax=Lentimicrobium sp. TaxID=2034841 RepID=UPI002B9A530F|nr:hypothetical protein [Lentimicrobium sp.]HPR25532.1 hypothetical protein [Lentimicrobium sp.]
MSLVGMVVSYGWLSVPLVCMVVSNRWLSVPLVGMVVSYGWLLVPLVGMVVSYGWLLVPLVCMVVSAPLDHHYYSRWSSGAETNREPRSREHPGGGAKTIQSFLRP